MSAATDKMRAEGLPDDAIDTFARYEQALREGDQGELPESAIEPLDDLPDVDELPDSTGEALDEAVVLKLNGGLGTSMGMTKAKSLLEVKEGRAEAPGSAGRAPMRLTFLDVIVRQVLDLRERHGARLPLLLMNSFATRDDTLAALERYPDLQVDDLPLDFMQGKVPKLLADSGEPADMAGRPRPRVGAARPRRRLQLAANVGHAGAAAGGRIPLPVPVELRQPRRRARAAHPRLVRE